jgi:hypothetical protein
VLTITLIAIAHLWLDLLSAELFAGFCVAASKSFSSDIFRFFTASPTNKSTPILVQYKGIEKWNGILPQVSGGGCSFC